MSWTDARVELLKRLWADGNSASAIAKELGGVTRNAVIGKVHRLGLSNRQIKTADAQNPQGTPQSKPVLIDIRLPEPKAKEPKAGKPSAPSKPPKTTPVVATILPADRRLPPQPSANEISPEALASHREVMKNALRLSLMELTERTCKWPFGDPATDDFWFCGLPVEPGKCYCAPCAKIAYQPALSRRSRGR